MSLAAFSKFEGPDIVAFVGCGVVGYFCGSFAPAGSGASIYITVLVSYHLFLAWLILFSTGHKDAGVSLPAVQTVMSHAACLFIIMSPVVTAVHTIPHFGKLDYDSAAEAAAADHTMRAIQALCSTMAGLAMFERKWLFSNEAPVEKVKPVPAPVAPVVLQATADDFQAWQQHLAQQKKGPRPLGTSLKTEYEQWLLARHQARAAQRAGEQQGA